MGLIITTIILILLILLLINYYIRFKQSHWERLKVPFIKPQFPYGNVNSPDGKKMHFMFLLQRYYNEMKSADGRHPFGGLYFFHKPTVLTLDLEFLKKVLIKDFNHFHDRGVYYNERDDPLSAHLFAIDGQKWRFIRSKLSPTFTSGKMKFMFPTICNVAQNLEKCLRNAIELDETIEMKDILARFSTDVIGTCAFGIECNSLNDPLADFHQIGKRVFERPATNVFQRLLMSSFKSIARFFKMKLNNEDVLKFFLNSVRETVEYRESKNIQRNDFMDILIELKNGNKQLADEPNNNNNEDHHSTNNNDRGLSLNEISAQAFVFFIAGFETSSTTITFCLYELAANPVIQNKLRHDIEKILKKYNNELTYEAIMDMDYLEQVINETLRKYPPVGNLIREVTKDYYVPEYNCWLKTGTSVLIPIYGIHHDPELYPKPEHFDPERFTSEAIGERLPMSFLPFGEGPRNCIGLRFGLMQTRIALITLLTKFQFSISPKLKLPIALSNQSFVLVLQDGLYLNVKTIHQ